MITIRRCINWFARIILIVGKRILLQILEGFIKFGCLSLRTKLITFSVLSVSIILTLGLNELVLKNQDNLSAPFPSSLLKLKASQKKIEDNIFTVQIAAVTSAKQAEKTIERLKKRDVDSLYIVKSLQRAGGYWYKIRVGHFTSKDQAIAYANRLVDSKSIKNYFVISLPKK